MTDQTSNPILQTKIAIAEALGVDPGEIEQIQPQWLRFMKSGIVVDLHIGRWRGRSKLTYADLGLPDPRTDRNAASALGDLLTLGKKNLLPGRYLKKFDAIEANARKLVADNSARTYWGGFVTAERYKEKVKGELERFEADYFALLEEMLLNFDAVIYELSDEYRHQARLAYHRMNRIAPDLVRYNEHEFVENFVTSITALVPRAEEIRSTFKFEWDLRFIPLPDLLAENYQHAAEIQMETQLTYEQLNHEQTMNRIEEDAARRRVQLQLDAEMELQNQVRQKAYEQKEEQVTNFMRDLVVQLRTMVYEASTDVLGTLGRNDHLHPRSVVQLRNLIDAVQQMNFFGDREVDQMIAQVRQQMNDIRVSEDKSTQSMASTLEAIATMTRTTLLSMGEHPRSARSLGIADVPTVEDTRKARQVLEIPEIKPVAANRARRQS